jgi:hypothetical protein
MTVELQRKPWRGWRNPRSAMMTISRSLPFFQSGQGNYIHRIRSGRVHFWDNAAAHTTFELWCGQLGHTGNRSRCPPGRLMETTPPGATLCATCEGRAIGAGQLGSRMICGRIVKFSPRI